MKGRSGVMVVVVWAGNSYELGTEWCQSGLEAPDRKRQGEKVGVGWMGGGGGGGY